MSKLPRSRFGRFLFDWVENRPPIFTQTELLGLLATTPQYQGRKLSRSFMSQIAVGKLRPSQDLLDAIASLIRNKMSSELAEPLVQKMLAEAREEINLFRSAPVEIVNAARETLDRNGLKPETVDSIEKDRLGEAVIRYWEMSDEVAKRLKALNLPANLADVVNKNPILLEWLDVCRSLGKPNLDKSKIEEAMRKDQSAMKLALYVFRP